MAEQPAPQISNAAARAAAFEKLIRWQHRVDLLGLLSIYPKDKIIKGAVLPALLTLIICGYLLMSGESSQEFLKEVVDSTVSVLPNLLGFLLGGYTILIGFGDKELLKSTTTIVKGRSISLFQMLSSIFALTIFIQALALGIALVMHFTLLIHLKPGDGVMNFFFKAAPYVNGTALPLVLFLLLYSVLSLRDMVMNVFGFAQQYHLSLTKDRLQDEYQTRNPKTE